jgi:hypothetical protein
MRKPAFVVTVLALVLAVSAALSAHHSFAAEFDADHPIRLKGVVTTLDWTNPHVWIYIDVKKPDGTVENWAFEASTPNVLVRSGLTRQSLAPGTVIAIDGYAAKDRTHRGKGLAITFEDGRTLPMRSGQG